MKNFEILAPAGSFDALRAAIAGGANAVYLAGRNFGARAYAKNFDDGELASAVKYAHARSCKVYVTVNTIINDREMKSAVSYCKFLYESGADALIVQDLGLASILREAAPSFKLHASTQMAVHNLDAVRFLEERGFKRVVLARELSRENIKLISAGTDLELEAFVHGSLCYSHSGMCLMSAVIGRRSANRGRCAGPCRLPYTLEGAGKSRYMLSLKDLCLAGSLCELASAGITSLKIEGRMKRPRYVYEAARIYAKAAAGEKVSAKDMQSVGSAFSRGGFTDSYFEGKASADMLCDTEPDNKNADDFTAEELAHFDKSTLTPLPVEFYITVEKEKRIEAKAICGCEETTVVGEVPDAAENRSLKSGDVVSAFSKTGGTGFKTVKAEVSLDEGVAVPAAELNKLRREALLRLEAALAPVREPFGETNFEFNSPSNKKKDKVLYARFLKFSQIPSNVEALKIAFLPLDELVSKADKISGVLERGIELGVSLPRVLYDNEKKTFTDRFNLIAKGVSYALCDNIGGVHLCAEIGLTPIGGIGLNIFNSHALSCAEVFTQGVTLSPELSAPQIRDILPVEADRDIPTGIFAYGRLPLFVCEHCVYRDIAGCGRKNCNLPVFIKDRMGERFPIVRDHACRTIILNSKKIYLADKKDELSALPLDFLFLSFTDESAEEAGRIIEAYSGGAAAIPQELSRGLYFRGVE